MEEDQSKPIEQSQPTEQTNPFKELYSKKTMSTRDYELPDIKDMLNVFGNFSETAMQGEDAMNTAQRSKKFSDQMQDAYKSIMSGDIFKPFNEFKDTTKFSGPVPYEPSNKMKTGGFFQGNY